MLVVYTVYSILNLLIPKVRICCSVNLMYCLSVKLLVNPPVSWASCLTLLACANHQTVLTL